MGKSNLKKLYIASEKVVDRQGNVLPGRPEDYPEIVIRAKAMVETMRTGLDYKIVRNPDGAA